MRRLLPLIPIVLILALGTLFATYGLHHDPQVFPAALVGKPLPTIALPPIRGGQPTRIGAALKGPGIVNVFGSWCAPCAIEAPQLMKLKANGVNLVGVSWMDEPGNTLAFLDRLGDPFSQVLVDKTGDAAVEFGISGAPETFVVDAKGMVVAKRVGPLTDADVAAMTRRIKLLQRP
jgi:cytochrome c biogenesis protein CcmG/thiol:disulfide interchange protein DsbE